MSFRELNNWIAYYSIEPFPDEERRIENARLLSILVTINSKKKVTPDKFLLDYWKKETPKVITKIPIQVEIINSMLNKRENKF